MGLEHTTISCVYEGCFAVVTMHPDDVRRLRRTHESFYCPAGHKMSYGAKSDEEKELERLQRRIKLSEDVVTEWRQRWEVTRHALDALNSGVRTCPLGCGWSTRRNLRVYGFEELDVVDDHLGKFLDRCGSDLAEHLRSEHNALRVDPVQVIA